MRRLFLAFLCSAVAGIAAGLAAETVRLKEAKEQARLAAEAVRQSIVGERLATKLADYASGPAGDPSRCESFIEAARRIVAGGAATKRTPDETIFTLDELADQIFSAASAIEARARSARTLTADIERDLVAIRTQAHIARFHARRIVAAMHYNLFLRSQRLAELVAATYAEKDAVEAWRQLTTLPAARGITEARRAELRKLEASYKDLEDQCCPPDENILKEKVWRPTRRESPKIDESVRTPIP
ncbi:MAG: hypothetical protein JNL39_21985 [Opitutaceae bacterium]|nr:hypothetical protein [Opitutaceae bacterium]